MGKAAQDDYRVCDKCGSFYLNFCLNCEKRGMDERVWEIMNRYKLNEEELIRILADMVADGKFPALNLAIALRDMKPADKHEVDISAGKDVRDARDRLHNLLSRLAKCGRQE